MFKLNIHSQNLTIAKLGEEVLRNKAKTVENILDEEIQKFISDLHIFVKNSNGVGIAAPQVFKSLQIIIISSKPNIRYPHAPSMEPFVIINPKIIQRSDSKNKDWEGCLSVPGIRAKVPRYDSIKVEYYNEKNEKKTSEFEGFIARVFQHEYDHLKGLVFLDNIESTKDIINEELYFKIIA